MKNLVLHVQWVAIMSTLLLCHGVTSVVAQETIRFDLMIGETEKNLNLAGNSTRLNLAGNSTRIPLRFGDKDLTLILTGPEKKSAELVLFAIRVRGNEVVGVEASEPFKVAGSNPNQKVDPGAKFLESVMYPGQVLRDEKGKKSYPGQVLRDQKVGGSTAYPVIPWDVPAKAYGLVAPRRDPIQLDRLKGLVLPEVAAARKVNRAPDAAALVLFVTGPEKCGDKCAVESQLVTLLLDSEL